VHGSGITSISVGSTTTLTLFNVTANAATDRRGGGPGVEDSMMKRESPRAPSARGLPVSAPSCGYSAAMREQVRVVMRYAGPRMLRRHPWLALAHIVDGRRPAPDLPAAPKRPPSAPGA